MKITEKMKKLVDSKPWKNITGAVYLVTSIFMLVCILLMFMGVANKIVVWMLDVIGFMAIVEYVFYPTGVLIIISFLLIGLYDKFTSDLPKR